MNLFYSPTALMTQLTLVVVVIFNFKFRRNQLAIQVIVLIGVSCSIFQFYPDPHGASIIEDDVESRLLMEEPEYLWF